MPRLKGNAKPKHMKATLSRLFSYLKDYNILLLIVAFCILIATGASLVSSFFSKVVIDDYITVMLETGENLFPSLLKTVGLFSIALTCGVLATFTYNLLMVKISQSTLKKIREETFAKMQTLPIRYFDSHTNGEIMSHFTTDIDAIENMLCDSIPEVFSSVVTILGVFIAMLFTSIYLTLVVVGFVGIMFVLTKFLGGKSKKYFTAQQKSIGKTTGFIEEMINGQKVVKVFNHEAQTKIDFDKINNELCFNATQANKYANIFMPIMGNLGNLQYVIIAIIGGLLVSLGTNLSLLGTGTLTVGSLTLFLLLSRGFTRPLSTVSQQMNSIIVALAGSERVFELIDEEPEINEGKVKLVYAQKDKDGKLTESKTPTGVWAWKDKKDGKYILTELKGDVRFFDVDFGYTPEKIVLHNISLYAKPGQKVAFVGATGAGKTTITNLINRFYDIADGKIRYDGININRISKQDLRRSIGMVLQDTNLFTGTVKDNIKYGNLDATDEQVFEAAKLANADGFIQRLPQGYDTMLTSNGANLSQGQRQLISIARAAIANAPVMILDEATSSIDTHTESLIQKGMDALMKGRTVFVIAHRLSTVQNANVIMVLENGRIIEKGTHDDLIDLKGKYYGLYTGAFELE